MASASQRTYRYALESLHGVIGDRPIDADAVGEWVTRMAADNIKLSTTRYYIENVRALARRAGADVSVFDAVASRMAPVDEKKLPAIPAPARVLEALARISAIPGATPDFRLIADILLLMVYQPGFTPADILALTTDNLPTLTHAARSIVDRNISRRRKFVFPLGQGRRTDRQLIIDLVNRLSMMTSSLLDTQVTFDDVMARALWIAVAIHVGVSPRFIATIVDPMPRINHAIMIVEPRALDPMRRSDILNTVANAIACRHRPHWHAMKLRTGVTPDDIAARVAATPGLTMPATFYPTVAHAVRTPRRIKYVTRPVLPGILFFNCLDSTLRPFLTAVADLARAYRQSANDPASPVAVIPAADMLAFQKMTAIFTPDILLTITDRPLPPGTPVLITDGPLAGLTATITRPLTPPIPSPATPAVQSTATASQGSPTMVPTTFRLKITNNLGINFTADLPSTYLTPLTSSHNILEHL